MRDRRALPVVGQARGTFSRPLLYSSLHREEHGKEYHDRLQRTRTDGDWEGWLRFFLGGVREVAVDAATTARNILDQQVRDADLLRDQGKSAGNLLRFHDFLLRHPLVTVDVLAERHSMSVRGAANLVERLVNSRILEEVTGRRRWRMFKYAPYLAHFERPRRRGR